MKNKRYDMQTYQYTNTMDQYANRVLYLLFTVKIYLKGNYKLAHGISLLIIYVFKEGICQLVQTFLQSLRQLMGSPFPMDSVQ